MGRDGFLCLKGLEMKDLKSRVVVLSLACAHSSVYVSLSYYDCFDQRAKRLFLSLNWFGPSLSKGSTCRCFSNAVWCCFWCRFAVVFPPSFSQSKYIPTYTTHTHTAGDNNLLCVSYGCLYRDTEGDFVLRVMPACRDF